MAAKNKAHITIDGGDGLTFVNVYGFYYEGIFTRVVPIELPARYPVTVTVSGTPEDVEEATAFIKKFIETEPPPPQEKRLSRRESAERFEARQARSGFTGRWKDSKPEQEQHGA